MTEPRSSARHPLSSLIPHLKGHVLLFNKPASPAYSPSDGLKLLAIFILLEGVIGPRLWLLSMAGIPLPPAWLRVPVLLALAFLLVRFVAGVPLANLGLRRWSGWSTIEKSYFIQVAVLVNVVFCSIFASRLRAVLADPALRTTLWVMAATHLLWGFYQELVYRGILQTELVRRWGGVAGILLSNILFTFGPLHWYHFSTLSPSGRLVMFAGIFAIGLFFGVLFRRSGNLWIVAIFHGIGDVYITGLGQLAN